MSLGIFGAHRTGKSTLADSYAQHADVPLVLTTTSDVFKRLGLDPQREMDFATRLRVQREILKSACEQWDQAPAYFVSDRTPLDYMAYTLADVTGMTGADQTDEFLEYMDDCFEALNRHFTTLVLLQPGIEIVDAGEKKVASPNPLLQEHINSLVWGLARDSRNRVNTFHIRRDILDLGNRVGCLMSAVERTSQKFAAEDVIFH